MFKIVLALAVAVAAAQYRSSASEYHTHDYKSENPVVGRAQGAYKSETVNACCKSSCGKNKDCKVGCDMWLQKSSLNSDSPTAWKRGDGKHSPKYTNHKLLQNKCKADCKQGNLWKNMAKFMAGSTKGHGPRPTIKGAQTAAYWKAHVGHAEQQCMKGCNKFKQCMPLPPTQYPTSYPTTAPTPYPTPYPTAYPTSYPTSAPTCTDQLIKKYTNFQKDGTSTGCKYTGSKLMENEGGKCIWTSKMHKFDNTPFEALDVVFGFKKQLQSADFSDHVEIQMRVCTGKGKGCTGFHRMSIQRGDRDGKRNDFHYVEAHSFGESHKITTAGVLHSGHGYLQMRVLMDNDGRDAYFSHYETYHSHNEQYHSHNKQVFSHNKQVFSHHERYHAYSYNYRYHSHNEYRHAYSYWHGCCRRSCGYSGCSCQGCTKHVYHWVPVYRTGTRHVYGWRAVYKSVAVMKEVKVYKTRPVYKTRKVWKALAEKYELTKLNVMGECNRNKRGAAKTTKTGYNGKRL